jgi:hypothetical protein
MNALNENRVIPVGCADFINLLCYAFFFSLAKLFGINFIVVFYVKI